MVAFGCVWGVSCDAAKVHPVRSPIELAPGVQHIGYISDPRITESSGVIVSRTYTNVFWTHNDGPKSYTLFGITRGGQTVASFHVAGVLLHDWEDIAIDSEHHVYIGDIGNNDARRFSIAVHQIDEPDPKLSGTSVSIRRSWNLRFPGAPFDCESLFIWGSYGYVISKVFNDARAEIYRFPLTQQTEPFTLELVTQLKIESPVTGADLSADGKLLGIVAKSGAFVYPVNGNIAKAGKVKPWHTKFKQNEHIEGCTFVPDGLLATAETRDIYLFNDPAFHPGK